MPSSEILAVLADEVSEAEEALKTTLANLVSADNDSTFAQAIELYTEQVERIDNVAKILSMAGLREICAFLISNLGQLGRDTLNHARQEMLEQWPKLVLGYLRAPKEGVYSRELAEHFHKSDWPAPLNHGNAIGLEKGLLAINDAADDSEPKSQRQTNAVAEDISLEPASNINPVLMDAFLSEGPLQAAQFSSVIERIVRGDGFANEVDEARRVVHAMKGAANTVNVRGVATMAHHVEDILEYLADNAITPSGELAKLLVKVADCMEIMFEALLGTGEPPSDTLRILQDVLILANRIDSGHFEPEKNRAPVDPAAVTPTAEPVVETTTYEVEKQTPDPVKPAKDSATMSPQVKIEPKLRIPARAIDDMLNLSGEIAISRGHIQERMQQTLKLLAELHERDNALWVRANNLENLVSTQGIAAGKRQALATTLEGSTNTEAFDPLEMDQYSELHTQVHGFVETIADLQLLGTQVLDALTTVESSVNQQTMLNNELHDLLMTSRMIPVSTLVPRLQRTVRQAAEKSGKLATLTVEGGDVMLDDQMVNELIDPLLHILRNAVDHGLEKPEARGQINKVETGSIVLGFARDGNYLNIRCQDDGVGLDLFRIHATAVDRGLITEQQNLTDEEITRLILQPGFSTATEVTELSGRGVGMDIVNTSITKLKGTIDIKTEIGAGCTFILRVPISMGMAHCLLADVDKQVFALPSDKLDRIIYSGANNITLIGKRLVYRDEVDTCPVYILSRLLRYSDKEEIDAEDDRTVILMRDVERGKIAIVVDKVSSGRDLVIKTMGNYVTNVSGVVGTSILGDGTVVPILEISDMMHRKQGLEDGGKKVSTVAAGAQPKTKKESGDILIVDDSLSVRTALTLLLNSDNMEVRTAKDGVEAMEEIEKALPAAILLDMEMPRMNGLEFTALIRSKAETKHLPIIMVTSRTADKHRTQAQLAGVNHYVTKPYQENNLLALLRLTMSKAA